MILKQGESAVEVRVRYSETDKMGFVYHSNYFGWFESARAELLRKAGVTYKELEEKEKIFLPVTECSCRYLKAACYDEKLIVKATIAALSRARIQFNYELFRETGGELIAAGTTTHAITNGKGRPLKLSKEKYNDLFNSLKIGDNR